MRTYSLVKFTKESKDVEYMWLYIDKPLCYNSSIISCDPESKKIVEIPKHYKGVLTRIWEVLNGERFTKLGYNFMDLLFLNYLNAYPGLQRVIKVQQRINLKKSLRELLITPDGTRYVEKRVLLFEVDSNNIKTTEYIYNELSDEIISFELKNYSGKHTDKDDPLNKLIKGDYDISRCCGEKLQ